MQESEWLRILEPALHAQIAVRCHRAYRHDLKNGLQGIYGGFDAMGRLLQAPAKDLAKIERITDFVRQAITGHEKSLERVLLGLSPPAQSPEATDVSGTLRELVKFLTNDATANRVSLRNTSTATVNASLRPHRLRLVLLSLMIDAIDAMPQGGELQLNVSTSEQSSLIQMTDTRSAALPADPWSLDLTTSPPQRGWTLYVVRQLLLEEGGSIECEARSEGGRRIQIALPA